MATTLILPSPDALKTFAESNSFRIQYNEALWDWLESNGYTQDSLNDKIRAASLDNFSFELSIGGAVTNFLLIDDAGHFLLIDDAGHKLEID